MKVRPITVIVALVAVAALASVALAWRGSDSAQVVQPASLPLAMGGTSFAGGTATTAMAELARLDRVTYVRGPGMAEPAGSQRASSLPSGPPDRAAVTRLAHAFGLTGAVVERDGQLVVAGPDGLSLQVTLQGGSSWYLGGQPQAVTSSGLCAGVGGVVPDTTIPSDSSPSAPMCATPPAPVDVPDGPTAEAAARRLLADAGLDLTHAEVTSVANPYETTVRVQTTLDGVAVEGLETTVVFGDRGTVQSANGWLGHPAPADVYPLIGVDAAIARLQSGEGQVGIRPMLATADGPVTTGTTQVPPPTGAPVGPTTTVTMPSGPMPPDSTPPVPTPTIVGPPTEPTIVEPVPEPTLPVPRDITVTITRATVVLVAVPGTDGSLWLVPAYRLESADAGSGTVLAIDPSFIAPPPTTAGGEPAPGSGSSGSGGSTTPGSSPDSPGQIEPSPPAGPGATCGGCAGVDPSLEMCCASASTTTSAGG
ncbi:MAG TPA: hypothetical protein VIJ47_12465 [Acidimicrobiales bacterium]